MRIVNRRNFLKSTAWLAAASGVAQIPLNFLSARRARAVTEFGPLRPDPMGMVDLPEGFTYRVLERRGDMMSDGLRVPAGPDGMGCFLADDGNIVLLRNHELTTSGGPFMGSGPLPAEAYRPSDGLLGGVSRLVIDPATGERVSSNLVLVGTARNCAGGETPWGWITCEESGLADHGWSFITRVDADGLRAPERVDAYGRFYREALCIDPVTNAAYMTEDQGVSCLYRFLPDSPASPFEGRLQALAIGSSSLRMSNLRRGDVREVRWIDCPTSDLPTFRVIPMGAASFDRGEGIWWAFGAAYICTTAGGVADAGQIFRLVPTRDGGLLEVMCESPDPDVLDSPDNVVATPWGDILMCEDGDNPYHIRLCDGAGNISDFARNRMAEWAGACFSPDGQTLFVNIQGAGLTLSITGPFPMRMTGELDAGVPLVPDAGPPNDAGGSMSGSDGGSVTPGADGGSGMPPASTDGGCGCSAAGASPGGGASAAIAGTVALGALAASRAARRDEGTQGPIRNNLPASPPGHPRRKHRSSSQ